MENNSLDSEGPNIIPLIDVLLVLLCILFLMMPSVGSRLPLEVSVPEVPSTVAIQKDAITLQISSDGTVKRMDLNSSLSLDLNSLSFLKNREVLLAADQSVSWALVADVLSKVTQSGAKVSVVVQPAGSQGQSP